jgi:hypothetical protein
MNKIRIHGMLLDNAGAHQVAGAELTVSDEKKAGHITASRAAALVAIHSATPLEEKTTKKAAKAD